jgi:GH15 family glucan-1,4-alpha-glucosidase
MAACCSIPVSEREGEVSKRDYPPIADYGFIADCHCGALVSKAGSIDWCCLPRFDSTSCFGRLLDWQQGGYCQIVPAEAHQVSRRYVGDSLVLETTFETKRGKARLVDCFTMRRGGEHDPHRQILRMLEGIEGQVVFSVALVPRFEFGIVDPWIRRFDDHYTAIGGSNGLLISGDLPLQAERRHDLAGRLTVKKGQHYHLSLLWRPPEDLEEGRVPTPSLEELDGRLQETIDWWHSWASQCTFHGPYEDYVLRSALVLKGLINAPTGALVAAPTTSLPEAPSGVRNWDYRFSWVRDSSFAVDSLLEVGFDREADGFRRFVERSSAGGADQLQTLYGLGGERSAPQRQLEHLEGYRRARPVRVGNVAKGQLQLDVFGEVLNLAWHWHARGHSPDDDYWEYLTTLLSRTCAKWNEADHGIWEMPRRTRHFVQSKVMCWAALNHGIRLAQDLHREAPVATWTKTREKIRAKIERSGYDHRRGVFIQSFRHHVMDAALLLIPTVGFLAYDDERMVRTTNAIRQELGKDGFLYRYPPGDDRLKGKEGVFLACSFWLVRCLAHQGRHQEAQATFERALSAANDLQLFSEEFDPRQDEMLGNFPQALTHLSLITAAVAMARTA